MNTTDIILLIIFVLAAYSGYKKGFIMEIIAVVAFILAIIGGFKLLHVGMEYVSKVYDGFGTFLPFVSFLVLFVLIIITVNVVGNAIKKIVDWTPFGLIDSIAGAVVGVMKWALLLSIVIWVMSGLDINVPVVSAENSRLLPYVTDFADLTSDFLSALFPSFEDFVKTIEELFQSFTA